MGIMHVMNSDLRSTSPEFGQSEVERLRDEVNKHKRNAMWATFLLTRYRNMHKIVSGKLPERKSTCYKCHKKYKYTYETSKDWFVFESGTVSCKDCLPSMEWMNHVVDACENMHTSCCSTSRENTDFSVASRWLVHLLNGDHTVYCTD